MKLRTTAIAALALMATTLAAQAQAGHHAGGPDRGRRAAMTLEQYDANGDGAVTQAEIGAALSERLSRFDADGDGQLTLEEYAALDAEQGRARMVDRFQALDADGDGSVTGAEMTAPAERLTARLDRDGDGDIDADDRPVRGAGEGNRGGDRPERPVR